MEALLLAVAGAVNIGCFAIGARVGRAAGGERGQRSGGIPRKSPKVRQDQPELDRLETIMHNIEAYDGTGHGQRDVPGGFE